MTYKNAEICLIFGNEKSRIRNKIPKEMKGVEELRQEIEAARKKLDEAIGKGYNEQTCYSLSIELDELIERYIEMVENTRVPTAG